MDRWRERDCMWERVRPANTAKTSPRGRHCASANLIAFFVKSTDSSLVGCTRCSWMLFLESCKCKLFLESCTLVKCMLFLAGSCSNATTFLGRSRLFDLSIFICYWGACRARVCGVFSSGLCLSWICNPCVVQLFINQTKIDPPLLLIYQPGLGGWCIKYQ